MINFVVAQGEKGLRRPCSSTAPLPPGVRIRLAG